MPREVDGATAQAQGQPPFDGVNDGNADHSHSLGLVRLVLKLNDDFSTQLLYSETETHVARSYIASLPRLIKRSNYTPRHGQPQPQIKCHQNERGFAPCLPSNIRPEIPVRSGAKIIPTTKHAPTQIPEIPGPVTHSVEPVSFLIDE